VQVYIKYTQTMHTLGIYKLKYIVFTSSDI